ncbi:hypothetical protein GB937_007618 [Aspergillus fischeri]|nr:hypothetical protein GB937_007618 [Aspergillus fischeri]
MEISIPLSLIYYSPTPPSPLSYSYVVKAPGLPPPTTGLSPSASTTLRPDSSCLVSGPSAAFSCTWPRVIIPTLLKGYGLLELTRLLHLTRRTANAPNTATDPTPTPIPIPTFAPVDSEESRGCDADADIAVEGTDAAVVAEEELEGDTVLTEVDAAVDVDATSPTASVGASVIASDVPQHAVLFCPQHQVFDSGVFSHGVSGTPMLLLSTAEDKYLAPGTDVQTPIRRPVRAGAQSSPVGVNHLACAHLLHDVLAQSVLQTDVRREALGVWPARGIGAVECATHAVDALDSATWLVVVVRGAVGVVAGRGDGGNCQREEGKEN